MSTAEEGICDVCGKRGLKKGRGVAIHKGRMHPKAIQGNQSTSGRTETGGEKIESEEQGEEL